MITTLAIVVGVIFAAMVLPLVVVGWMLVGLVAVTGLLIFLTISAGHHTLLAGLSWLRKKKSPEQGE